MFKLLSDLSTVQRKEIPINVTGSNVVFVSGYSGSWVTLDSNGYAILTSGVTGLAWPVWNESNRNGTQGWSPDVKQAKSVTVFFGKVRAYTDRYDSSSIVLGSSLMTAAGGVLTLQTGSNPVVAYCRKAAFSYTQFGTAFNVIEIETV
jgi:hypothetical protein